MIGAPHWCGGGLEIGADNGVICASDIDVADELLLVCNDGGCISDARLL